MRSVPPTTASRRTIRFSPSWPAGVATSTAAWSALNADSAATRAAGGYLPVTVTATATASRDDRPEPTAATCPAHQLPRGATGAGPVTLSGSSAPG